MIKYVKPTYETEGVEVNDVILASALLQFVGEGTLGNITGNKAQISMDYSTLFGNR